MINFEKYQRFSVQDTLLIGDATKTLFALTAGRQIFVTACVVTGIVAAAQTVYVGDTSGTVKVVSLAASFPVHSQADRYLTQGLGLTVGEALIVKPGAAGPSVHVVCEGYVIGPF